MDKFRIELVAKNSCGVLARIVTQFSKHGYFIESLHTKESEDGTVTAITIIAKGDDYIRNQAEKQLFKLYDVVTINSYDM